MRTIHFMKDDDTIYCDPNLTLEGLHPTTYPKAQQWPDEHYWISDPNRAHMVNCSDCQHASEFSGMEEASK